MSLSTWFKYVGMAQQCKQLREITEVEAKIVNPAEAQQFRQALSREMGQQSRMQAALSRNLTMEKITEDPGTFQVLMSDPRALAAVQDVVENPDSLEKYREKPELYKALKKIFEL